MCSFSWENSAGLVQFTVFGVAGRWVTQSCALCVSPCEQPPFPRRSGRTVSRRPAPGAPRPVRAPCPFPARCGRTASPRPAGVSAEPKSALSVGAEPEKPSQPRALLAPGTAGPVPVPVPVPVPGPAGTAGTHSLPSPAGAARSRSVSERYFSISFR